MPTKSQKGNQFQDWIQKWLEKQGYIVHNQKPAAKMIRRPDPKTGQMRDFWVSSRNDIFSCIDLIAIRPNQILWIQATTDTGIGRKKKKIKDSKLFEHMGCNCGRILVFIKRSGSNDVYIYTTAAMIMAGKIIRAKWHKSGHTDFNF